MKPDITRPSLRLGRNHFAFLRGYLDSLPLKQLGQMYLDSGGDSQAARETLGLIRHTLVAAAQRYRSQLGLTPSSLRRLLGIDPAALTVDEKVEVAELPSLEEFAAEQGLFDYSEAELIEKFEEHFAEAAPAIRIMARNDRIRKAIRDALNALEHQVVVLPKPGDELTGWLLPAVTDPLNRAGILTIDDLTGTINRLGNLWYRRIPGFGRIRADRLVRWLQLNEVVLLEKRALVPYKQFAVDQPTKRKAAFGIVPLEYLYLPPQLSGIDSGNRGTSQLASRTDLEVVLEWLIYATSGNAHTARAYRTHAERFLLFLAIEKERALSDATPADCHDYMVFLEALATPGADWPWTKTRPDWIGPKVPRWSNTWRPFAPGALSEKNRIMSLKVVRGMYAWLVSNHYLKQSPWKPVKLPRFTSATKIKVDHWIKPGQWQAVLEELDAMPRDEAYLRLRFILWLGYTTGLRQSELLHLTGKNLTRDRHGNWFATIHGKGSNEREVPIHRTVFQYLLEYMAARGHVAPDNPARWIGTDLPLISALGWELQSSQKRRDEPLAARSCGQLLKRHFDAAAERVDDLIDQHELRQASTHWLRHTAATEMIQAGAGPGDVQEILGHASGATTALYMHSARARKLAAVNLIAPSS